MAWRDFKFALRLFAAERVFFLTTVLTIALGVGLAATVFAIVDGVLFRGLPYRDPSRLVALYGAARAEQQLKMPVSVPDLLDWRTTSRTFERLEAYDLGRPGARVRGVEETVQSSCSAVTQGFLDMLGVTAAHGRTFAADDFTSGAQPVALISYRLWTGVFNRAVDVIGRPVAIGAAQHTVVGVLPHNFVFPDPGRRFAPDVLMPLDLTERAADRSSRFLYVIGRLASGMALQQAQTEMDGIALSLKPLFLARPNVVPGAFDGATLIDLRDNMTRNSRGALWLVFASVAVVFLIACVNVVGLLLAHAEDRRREFAVRSAIGAGRGTLVRLLLIEAGLLSMIGAAAGWFLSVAAVRVVVTQIPRWLQLMGEPRLDARAVAFAVGLALLTLVVAGLVPALRASAAPPRAALAAGTRVAGGGRGRHALIFLEVALATLLLSAGSIMLRSWIVLRTQDTGMDADRVIALRSIPAGTADAPRRARHNSEVADALRRIPGVQSVAFVDMPLLQKAIKGSGFIPPVEVPHPAGMDTDLTVTPGYFDTMGLALRMGRTLGPEDRGRGVVISEALARRYWPGRNPVGEIIRYRDGTREIVGVVSNARDVSLDRPPMPALYHVWDEKSSPIATIVIRFAGAAPAMIGQIRRAVRGVDADAAITMLSGLHDLLSVSVAERHFNTLLFTVFAAAGLLVALVGIYGLVAFVVAHREREMGIRLALGASGHGLELFIMAGTLRWVVAGLATGLGAALLCARYLQPFVYEVPANDPLALTLMATVFLVVAATATYIPARRAARVDPMIALRAE